MIASAATAATSQLVLSRDAKTETDIKGVVDLAVDPGFDGASVSVVLDGQNLATGLRSPYHVTVDFGPNPIEHKITVVARDTAGKRVQWSEMINRGYLPLTVKVAPVDLADRVFEATVTAPASDPVTAVEFWDNGKVIASLTDAPYRFTIPAETFQTQFVQVTAKTKSGDEAADFWSATGDVHAESVEVRTVPIYVSVVDRNGVTHDDVDRSLFRIIDNGNEGQILEFGKAFDQPISIALLVDASASMTYSLDDATKAAVNFVHRTLKPGDRCAVYAIRGVPRREVALTTDLKEVEKAITGIKAEGQTALYDGIRSAIRELRAEKNRKAIVVLSDGGDTSSISSFDEIDRLSKEAGIPLYFIAYDSGASTEQQEVDRMNYLAGETGGFLVTASAENLQAKYGDIEKDLRAQYAILYQISDLVKHNEWRKVRVMLNSPKLTARTIHGYFAP
ncbi:MAG TPA: VWA domain-containing protein [Thermoanaerobaculia bacterium]